MLTAEETKSLLAKYGTFYGDLTPDEQECVSAKVSKLHDEGYKGDQAVAIAIKQCAPSKARSQAAAGKSYRWSKNQDGTYNVFDVPVFSKHVRKLGVKLVADDKGEPKLVENVVDVDEKWLSSAVQTNQDRYYRDNYMGPLHIRHHPQKEGDPDTTEDAGHFVLKFVKDMEYDGERLPTVYADFLRMPGSVFERMKAGRLPYRSIESHDPTKGEIDSIALLSTDTPWFRYPLLNPDIEINREVYKATGCDTTLRGLVTAGPVWGALCYFTYAMPEGEEQSKGEKSDKPPKKDEKNSEPELAADAGDDEDIELMDEEDEGDDTMGAIKARLDSMEQVLQALLAKLGGNIQPPTTPPAGAPVMEPGVKTSATSPDLMASAKVTALEEVVNGMKIEKELDKKVKDAMKTLVRYNLGLGAEEKLFASARESKDPDRVITQFVETVKTYGTEMPTPANDLKQSRGKGVPPTGEKLSDEVKLYSSDPAKMEKALNLEAAYADAVRIGVIPRTMTKAEFLKYNLERDYSKVLNG